MSIIDFLARKGALEFSLGVAILLFLLLLALAAAGVSPFDPNAIDFESLLAPPSVHHPFGADHLGRDVLSRTIHALRIDLWMGLAGVVTPLVLGTFAGLAAGYFGSWTDVVLSRIIDVTIAFPFFVLVIAIVGLKTKFCLFLHLFSTNIARHDDDRVAEINFTAFSVSQCSVFENLQ